MSSSSGSLDSLGMIGDSSQMADLREAIRHVAPIGMPVLILGESGSGKELVARAIHCLSGAGEFVPIDCGTLVGPLVESELFGHTQGAFTGATQTTAGLIQLAAGGTAFFDEIGDLPVDIQVKLLRLLQEQEYRPVGASRSRHINFRLISATNHRLPEDVAAGRFRRDLYYRINVITVVVPSLRERRSDIPALASHFLRELERQFGTRGTLSDATMAQLTRYDWPGNVRELRSCVTRMWALGNCQDLCAVASLAPTSGDHLQGLMGHIPCDRTRPLREIEREALVSALRETHGDRQKAAKLLQIGRTTLYRKLKGYSYFGFLLC